MKKMIAAFKRLKDACIAYVCSHIFNADTSNDETCSATRYEQQEGKK